MEKSAEESSEWRRMEERLEVDDKLGEELVKKMCQNMCIGYN